VCGVASRLHALMGSPLTRVDEWKREVSAAAALFLPFVTLHVALLALAPPTASQLVASDPLVQAARAWAFPGMVALSSAAIGIGWVALLPPGRATMARALRHALVAVVVAIVAAATLRLFVGPSLPAFIPPEESAKPGMALGMGAGVVEEALFRLALLPLCFALLRDRLGAGRAALVAVAITSLAFAASHEVGPGALAFDARHFVTHTLVPGAAMGALFFRVGPAFIITLHCAAHVCIPLLFR